MCIWGHCAPGDGDGGGPAPPERMVQGQAAPRVPHQQGGHEALLPGLGHQEEVTLERGH